MATASKSKVLKSNKKAKGKNTSIVVAASKVKAKAAKKEMAKPVRKPAPIAAAPAKAAPVVEAADKKKVSQKLIETIEKRKNQAHGGRPGIFSKPPGRRGRRPKGAVEYTPEHREEEAYVMESDSEGIEYDTGIRVKESREEGFGMERFEEFDEELNFDW